ncbi:MAG: N-acetyl-D-Glu racemase DgcA [Hyphomicrobiaceae bacterium]
MPAKLLNVEAEPFPVAGTFTISRGARREAVVVVATVELDGSVGRGECVPYARYGETVDGVIAAIRAFAASYPLDRACLAREMSPGAARNALDCALVDAESKAQQRTPADLFGVTSVTTPRLTCFTLSLDTPDAMARKAAEASAMPLLKLKLGGGPEDASRLALVRKARPDARLVADANEAWRESDLVPLIHAAHEARLELIEQPLPAGSDGALATIERLVPICADESAHTSVGLAELLGRYDAVNIKLDKTGGIGEALAMAREARRLGLRVMVGCMLATSLAMAPAWLLAAWADWLDLDGPLLLARDRRPHITYTDGLMHPPPAALWG